MYWESSNIGEGNDNGGDDIREDNIYKNNGEELVLVLLSDLYLELEMIFVSISGLSSCSTLYFLLTTSTTDYYFEKKVDNFGLRWLFYCR